CCHVNSAEPASTQGELALPDSGTHPSGLSHSALKRTAIRSLEPSPGSCARDPAPLAGTAIAAAPRMAAPSARALHLRTIRGSLAAVSGGRQPGYQMRHMAFERPTGSPP